MFFSHTFPVIPSSRILLDVKRNTWLTCLKSKSLMLFSSAVSLLITIHMFRRSLFIIMMINITANVFDTWRNIYILIFSIYLEHCLCAELFKMTLIKTTLPTLICYCLQYLCRLKLCKLLIYTSVAEHLDLIFGHR